MADVVFWIVLLITIVVAIVALYLAVLIVSGKYKAKRKLGASVLLGIIIVFIISFLSNILDQIPIEIPPHNQRLFAGMAPYVAFFLLIFLVHWLMDVEWEKTIYISFITILIIVVTANILIGITGVDPLYYSF